MTDQSKLSPEDRARVVAADKRYFAAMHGMQSAVSFESHQPHNDHAGLTPKHLRVGVNSAMINDLAMARLLIDKGVFTLAEYHEAVAKAAEDELARYQRHYPNIKFA